MLRGRELRGGAALALCAALASGCAAPPGYDGMRVGGEGVVAFHCRHLDGDDAGMAYFDLGRGLAMMELSIGIDMAGKVLAVEPRMVGEVWFGSAKVVFSIPPGGGESEVTMFPGKDADPGQAGPRRKAGLCEKVDQAPTPTAR